MSTLGQPASFPLTLYRGDTYRFTFRVWEDAAKTIPHDLTGVTAKAEIRPAPSATPIIPFDCTITAPNQIALVLSHANSQSLPARAAWDLQLTYASGDVQTIVAGPVTTTPDITDSTLARIAAGVAAAQPDAGLVASLTAQGVLP